MDSNTGFSRNDIYSTNWDVIVIGAGAAGLMSSLELPSNLKILLLNRNTSKRSSSRWAQGGIASVVRPEDSFALHIQDTLKAGDGLCDLDAVEMLVKEAPICELTLPKIFNLKPIPIDEENGTPIIFKF